MDRSQLLELANKYGSPLYVYDTDKITSQYNRIINAFSEVKNVKINYAVKALSKGAKRANCWLNTGEGGLSPHHLSGNCDIVFQIGTAKYGVRDENGDLSDEKLKEIADLSQVKMFEIPIEINEISHDIQEQDLNPD